VFAIQRPVRRWTWKIRCLSVLPIKKLKDAAPWIIWSITLIRLLRFFTTINFILVESQFQMNQWRIFQSW